VVEQEYLRHQRQSLRIQNQEHLHLPLKRPLLVLQAIMQPQVESMTRSGIRIDRTVQVVIQSTQSIQCLVVAFGVMDLATTTCSTTAFGGGNILMNQPTQLSKLIAKWKHYEVLMESTTTFWFVVNRTAAIRL